MAERRSSSAPPLKKENAVADSADGVQKGDVSPDECPECPVCLQLCIHPVRLPCSHVFCFLCVKGAANQSNRCALCRQGIPAEFFNNPTLVVGKKDACGKGLDPDAATEHYTWFYEGRNGWWQYDKRTNADLEENYNAKKRTIELLVAGYMYVVDLDNMVQMRRNDPSRRRRIKRDLVSAPKKGIAGLKIAARPEGGAAAAEDQQASEAARDETAAGGTPPKDSGTGAKSVPAGGQGRTKSRSAGVGRDHGHEEPGRVPPELYDADDDDDGTDEEDETDVRSRGPRAQRQGGRPGCNTGSDLEPAPGARRSGRGQGQALPIRHNRAGSAPEIRPVDPRQEQANAGNISSAMHSLHLPAPDESVYGPTRATDQSAQRELRQRRRRQRQADDDIWF